MEKELVVSRLMSMSTFVYIFRFFLRQPTYSKASLQLLTVPT